MLGDHDIHRPGPRGRRAAVRAYGEAWLANDSAAVMAMLTPDAVLVPSGLAPLAGGESIRGFWWPADGPATTDIALDQAIDQVAGNGDLAVVRGQGSLSFQMTVGDSTHSRTSSSSFINVLARQPDGTWGIAQRMWSDRRRPPAPPAEP